MYLLTNAIPTSLVYIILHVIGRTYLGTSLTDLCALMPVKTPATLPPIMTCQDGIPYFLIETIKEVSHGPDEKVELPEYLLDGVRSDYPLEVVHADILRGTFRADKYSKLTLINLFHAVLRHLPTELLPLPLHTKPGKILIK